MSRMKYLIFVPLLFSLVLEGQTDVTIRKKDFKSAETGFKEAWDQVQDGDLLFKDGGVWFKAAYESYLKAIVYNNSNAELNYKTGVSALFSDKKEEAASFLMKALQLKYDVSEDILLLAGRALHYEEKFTEAVELFNQYLASDLKKSEENVSLAIKSIDECNSARLITKDTLKISIENLGENINSDSDDYSVIITGDGKKLFFASRKEVPQSMKRNNDTKFDENIFISSKDSNVWEPSMIAGKEITTKYCETPLYINSEGDILFIYAGYQNDGDIKMSVNKKDEWKFPEEIPYMINSLASESSFCISPEGDEIYYVTNDKKGNMGGKDIFYISKIKENKWSKPVNAGGSINTIYDEESVRFSRSGDTLWFSSRGHNTIGGFDIFFSVRNENGKWGSAQNLGHPVNTPWDEMFYYPSPVDKTTFYFVSNRKGGLGGLDIYTGRYTPSGPADDLAIIR